MRFAQARLDEDVQTRRLDTEQAAWLDTMIDSAARVAAEIARVRFAQSVAHAAQDALAVGIALLDHEGRVLRANLLAEHLFKELCVVEGANEAGTPRPTAASFAVPPGAAPRVTRLTRGDRAAVDVLAVALEPFDDPLGLVDARTLLFLVDPDANQSPSMAKLIASFGLTQAEARLASRLLRGETVQEASKALRVRMTTTRTHLRNLFAKTGTARQQDLMRLLLSVIVAFSPRWLTAHASDNNPDTGGRNKLSPM